MKVQTTVGEIVLRIAHANDPVMGRLTVAEVHTPDGKVYAGQAFCHHNDQFRRRRGVSIALGRALLDSTLQKNVRKEIWRFVWNGKYGTSECSK